MVSWNSASEGLAYIWQSKWVAIIAVKTNKTQIHFLSDVLVGGTLLDLKVAIITAKRRKGKNWSFLLLCFCRSVVMFRLCKVETSVNNLRHNDIKNQSERLNNYRSLSLPGTIFNMAASWEDVVGRDVKVHVDIWQLLSETLRLSYTTKPSRPQNKE